MIGLYRSVSFFGLKYLTTQHLTANNSQLKRNGVHADAGAETGAGTHSGTQQTQTYLYIYI